MNEMTGTTETVDVATLAPIDHAEGMALLATELDRTLEPLRALGPGDWVAPTDCPDWDVRRMYLHVLGACEAGASMRENLHQMRAGRRHRKAHGGTLEAGLSAAQVRERLDVGPDRLVERLAAVAPATVRGRTRIPAVVRKMKMAVDGPVVETWSLRYLIDVIYLRDAWMQRIDAARAVGRELRLTPEHDGRIVADVAREWADRHGQPFLLHLAGPAGGTYSSSGRPAAAAAGDPSPQTIELDAVEFCRTLAGRAEGTGLLRTIVPF